MANTRAAQKRKRANTASSTEGVHQSPPTIPKSSKQKSQGKKNKSKHSDPQLEIYPEFDQEAQDDAEERGRQLASQTSASSKSKKQGPKISKEANVPLPTQSKVKISNQHGPKSRDNRAREDGQRKAELWSRYAPSFKINKTLKELFSQRTNNEKALAKLAEYCDGELQSTPIIPFSGKYWDPNGKLIVAYFAARLEQPEIYHQQEVSKEPLPLEDQYKGCTEEDYIAAQKQGVKIHHDGIPASYLQEYWANIQWLSVALRPHLPTKDIRHGADPEALETYVVCYIDKTGEEVKECAGVHHLVHAWTEQGHENGPLCVSSRMLFNSSAAVAVQKYFIVTRLLAIFLGELFRNIFSEEYEQYKPAFEAGVWYTEDPGLWIGRAIVYKLDVQMHYDMYNGGPTATFSVGLFEGGCMELPTLRARFKYIIPLFSLSLKLILF
ncbi:hypothetical protein V8D89_005654 [Ganoderma adspersum]